MLHLSIVVPVYSGENFLRDLLSAVQDLRNSWVEKDAPIQLTELIFVDDNAIDNSAVIIDDIASEHDWVVALHLSRNFGQHPATIAGILHSFGDWVVTLDEDLQHPPSHIADMIQSMARVPSDIVYGKAKQPVHENGFRDISSRTSKRFIETLSGNKDITKASSFRLIRGVVARAAASVCGHDTYFDVALTWFTQRINVVEIEMKDTRFISTGKSGYNLPTLLSHARRMLFSNQIRPLRLVGLFGVFAVVLAVASALWIVALKLVNPDAIETPGWVSLFVLSSFLGGSILFMIGIVLEYMSTLVLRAHGKPLFFTIDRSGDQEILTYFSDTMAQ